MTTQPQNDLSERGFPSVADVKSPDSRRSADARMLPWSGTVVSNDGTRIAVDAVGDGPSLVLVSGALGSKDFPYLRKFAAELGKYFRVFAYDRRGRGDSTDTMPYSVEREVEDLAAVCREAGGSPIIIGISSGAALALEAAARATPMRGLVAFEAPYMVGSHRQPEHERFESDLRRFIERGDRDGAVKHFMRIVGVPAFFLAVMRLMPFWKALRRVAHTLPYDAAVMGGFELPAARLAQIRVPTLVVGGGKSPPRLKAAVHAVGEAILGAHIIEIPRQSHAVQAAALAPVIREFDARTRTS